MKGISKNIKLLEKNNVYYEKVFNGQHCYKYQVAGENIIIIQRDSQENAADEIVSILKERGIL